MLAISKRVHFATPASHLTEKVACDLLTLSRITAYIFQLFQHRDRGTGFVRDMGTETLRGRIWRIGPLFRSTNNPRVIPHTHLSI